MPIRSILQKISKKRILVIAAVCLLAALIGMAVYLCLPMPEGAALDGRDLSGMPYWKACAATNSCAGASSAARSCSAP